MNSARCNEFHRGLDCLWTACSDRGAVRCWATSKAEWGERWLWVTTRFLFSPRSMMEQLVLAVPAPLAGALSCSPGHPCSRLWQWKGTAWCWGTAPAQCGGATPWDTHHLCSAWGSQGHPGCHVQQVVTLVWKHMSHSQGKLPALVLVRGEGSWIHPQDMNLLGKILKMGILQQFLSQDMGALLALKFPSLICKTEGNRL